MKNKRKCAPTSNIHDRVRLYDAMENVPLDCVRLYDAMENVPLDCVRLYDAMENVPPRLCQAIYMTLWKMCP